MSFTPLTSLPVRARRLAVRHRWLTAVAPVLLGLGTYLAVERADDAAVAARDEWGDVEAVWVAVSAAKAGGVVAVVRRDVPSGLVPDGAVPVDDDIDGLTARRAIGAGEIVVDTDLDARPAPLALVPDGWLVVPIVESPPSGAGVGERVVLASDGVVLADDAVVVESGDSRTLVAVPVAEAPLIAFAASSAGVAVLRTGA